MRFELTAVLGALLLTTLTADLSAQVHPLARPLSRKKPPVVATKTEAPPTAALAEVSYLPPSQLPALPDQRVKYRPPEGFAGRLWGDARAKFERLPAEPLSVRAAWTRGRQRQPEMLCTGGAIGATCTISNMVDMVQGRYEGGGFHVLSEYKIEAQGFQFGNRGVLLHPVVYQFCAHWDSTKRQPPDNFDAINEFCGMRLLFGSESQAQLRELPEDHVTQYELVLRQLMIQYGKPSGFIKRGRVTIETIDEGDSMEPRRERKFSTWRWCPAKDRGLDAKCDASIVLSIEPESGRALVLYATPALWRYAYARQNGHAKGDPLFALMHARPASSPAR